MKRLNFEVCLFLFLPQIVPMVRQFLDMHLWPKVSEYANDIMSFTIPG